MWKHIRRPPAAAGTGNSLMRFMKQAYSAGFEDRPAIGRRPAIPALLLALAALFVLVSCGFLGVYHRVHKGETLYSIARTYQVPAKDIQDANYLRDPTRIYEGQKLYIPGAKKQKRVATAPKKNKVKAEPQKQSKPPGKRTASTGGGEKNAPLIWPVDGVVVSGFGMRSGGMHNGLDIAAPEGAPIRAALGGKVIYSDGRQRGYGNMVIIEHPGNLITVYAHNKENLVREGEQVKQGQIIARVGKTGRASGFHVHFEVRHNRQPVDPHKYLK